MPRPRSRRHAIAMAPVAGLLILAMLVLMLAGCNSAQIDAYKQQVADLNEQARTIEQEKARFIEAYRAAAAAIDGEVQAAREQAQAMDDGPEKNKTLAAIDKLIEEKQRVQDQVDNAVSQADAKLAEITGSIDRLDTALADVETPAGAAGATAQEIATYIPPPWNLLIAGLGAALLGFENRSKAKVKRALQSTVEAFEIAKREGAGTINFNDPAAKNTLRASMSTEARDAVDRARKTMADKNPGSTRGISTATTD